MQAITVRPQWAFAMLTLGKRIENRAFVPEGLFGARIALHSGKHVGGTPSAPATARGFRELACDMIRVGYLAAPVWFKGEEPFLAWQPIGATDRKSSYVLRDDDCPKGVVFATATIGRFVGNVPDEYIPPWAHEGSEWWILEEFRTLINPVPCSGQQGVWKLPDHVLRAVTCDGSPPMEMSSTEDKKQPELKG